MENSGKYVLITGGTEGIGYELAKLFAADGFNLVIVARHEEGLEKAASVLKESGVDVITIAKDLFDKENAFEIYSATKEKSIDIEILVNNAGQGEYGEFMDTDIDRELDIIQLNIATPVILTKLFLGDMLERGSGKILNLASIASKVPGPFHAVYHGTKAFMHSFTEAIRSEVKDTNITVTSLLPGATATDFFNKANMLDSKVVQEEELADPADVAKDGYDALMAGKDMVISGGKNKMQVLMGKLTSDSKAADKMGKVQEPVNEKD